MIELTRGNILDAPAEALVNTVNTVGVMGKGVALQFKKAFPENFKAYQRACAAGKIQPGRLLTVDLGVLQKPRFIINFPTKRHWRGRSRIEDIEAGLSALAEEIGRLGVTSIAIPPLGCGNGGLNWSEVYPLIERALAPLSDVQIYVYEPAGAPPAAEMRTRERRPAMTVGRAVVIRLIHRYLAAGFEPWVSLLEVHKLAYFAQVAGEPLKLSFREENFGPYADNLRHALNNIEGHYIQGVGDGRTNPSTPIQLLPKAAEDAESFLGSHSLTQERFARVTELIEGFETPFGMELLASVHWVAAHKDPRAKTDLGVAVESVQRWNERKAKLFSPGHIEAAWQRLKSNGWL